MESVLIFTPARFYDVCRDRHVWRQKSQVNTIGRRRWPVCRLNGYASYIFRLLSGQHGGAIRRPGVPDSHAWRVALAVALIRANFAKPLRMEHLAEAMHHRLELFDVKSSSQHSPQGIEALFAVLLGVGRVMGHEIHGGFRHRVHERNQETH
jgi:hypothetical protein